MYFDIESHRDCFKTNENEAYFWHGQTDGIGGQNNAMIIAAENNGKTLEKCMLEHREELEGAGVIFTDNDDGTVSIDYGSNRDESKRFWEDCSKAFAEQSSGNVNVIEGSDFRPNGQAEKDYPSVYNRVEHPALEQNPNVDTITHIDPKSHQVTNIENNNMSCLYNHSEGVKDPPIQNDVDMSCLYGNSIGNISNDVGSDLVNSGLSNYGGLQ